MKIENQIIADADVAADMIMSTIMKLDLPAGLGLTVYRTVQEGLSNARRHAGAPGRVEVRVNRGSEDLVVEVLDDGDGAPPAAASGGTSAGAAPTPMIEIGRASCRERV